MKKNTSLTAQEKKENHRGWMLVWAMITPVLFAVDLYVMIQLPQNYAVLVGVTILLLAGIYFMVNAIFQEIDENKSQMQEKYELILKSQKASYLIVKKVLERLEGIGKGSANPADKIISIQKAIAKMTITRDRENAEAMLNSNDKVLEKIVALEENVRTNRDILLETQRSAMGSSVTELSQDTVNGYPENFAGEWMDQSFEELRGSQEEILSGMRALDVYIRDELMQIQNAIQEMQETSITPVRNRAEAEETKALEESFDLGAEDLSEAIDFSEPEIPEETEEKPDLLDGFDFGISEEPEAGKDLEHAEDLYLGEELGSGEELDFGVGLDFGVNSMPEETLSNQELEAAEESAEQIEEIPLEDEILEDAEEMPNLSGAQKMLTPDEIAALIENL